MTDPLLDLLDRIMVADSMTTSLREWCNEFDIGEGPLWSDHSEGSGKVGPSPEAIEALQPGPGETIRHRGISLMRGDVGLLDADNWYVPERLPAETNRLLDETDTPFGAAVPHEGQTRKTLYVHAAEGLRAYLDTEKGNTGTPAPTIVVRAIVTLKGVPTSFVEERLRATVFTQDMCASV